MWRKTRKENLALLIKDKLFPDYSNGAITMSHSFIIIRKGARFLETWINFKALN